ncbi:hypothetical protein RhiirA4_488146 [Rhizophagus irregularis]|uniref:Uncharacterized protein n=1 Tax=Rhizophagus irregularis TaxID=588596 RepID=A0A2I1HTE3_9GLOM|nr:hypothetical protein RhiirA4_488146 [Rhizophagus irregularis]
MIGVAKTVFPFLVLLFFIVLGYAQAFFIVLRSNSINDDNDPWNIATKYNFINSDGTINNNITTIIQDPDSNTNLFNWFFTSLLAVYNLLTGDSGSLSLFTYQEEFLLQKAQIIMEIELFYMLPFQRYNNKKWFPDWIYYDIPVTEVRKLINAIDNEQTVFNYPPFISEKLRDLVVLTNNKKQDTNEEQDINEEQDRTPEFSNTEKRK